MKFLLTFAALLSAFNSMSLAQSPGSLSPELLSRLGDGYEMSSQDQIRYNAVTNNEINSLALNRQVIAGEDGVFSHKVKTKGMTNQKSSGRCWMFSGLNVLRPKVIYEQGLDEFEFCGGGVQSCVPLCFVSLS